jgi:hypothetical protein
VGSDPAGTHPAATERDGAGEPGDWVLGSPGGSGTHPGTHGPAFGDGYPPGAGTHGEPVPWVRLLADEATVARYRAAVHRRGDTQCWWWLGGLSSTAHGTFRAGSARLGTSRVVPAHLFGYRLEFGAEALEPGIVCRHSCDEPPCQNPRHWIPGERGDNIRDYYSRRHLTGHALSDVRGPRGRALAVQAAIKAAGPGDVEEAISAALAAGHPGGARQDPLF